MRKRIILCAGFLFFLICPAIACPFCNPEIKNALYDSRFLPNLVTMLSAFFVLGGVILILTLLAGKRHRANVARYPARQILTPVPLTTTSLVLGIGFGGFIDGIVLHQILQWHQMLSARLPPTDYVAKSVNMFWDGIFHAFTLVVCLVGVVLLWRLLGRKDIERSGWLLAGGMLAGWGIFNIIEGVIDHHLLKLHNVKEISSNPGFWNFGFLGLSVLMILLGFGIMRRRPAVTTQANP